MADENSGFPVLLLTGMARGVNALRGAVDAARDLLPGERPEKVVIEVRGSFPTLRERRRYPGRLLRVGAAERSLQEFERLVDTLLRAEWLRTVVFRFGELELSASKASALRRQFERLKAAGRRVEVYAESLYDQTYYLATAADEVVMPPSGELSVNGPALSLTFLGDTLARAGVRFDKLAIAEYKNAGDELALPRMSDAQREQYGAFLDSVVATTLEGVARGRRRSPAEVQGWIDAGIASAEGAVAAGMIDTAAYEDEYLPKGSVLLSSAKRYLPSPRLATAFGRVALVSVEGAIVTGPSRSSPVPLPVVGSRAAGSDTVVRALRAAGRDKRTRAVVLYVDSGGGSALASDLISREVALLAKRMPVVAVMGGVAASGGYYVLAHATHVVADAATLTGSIGVVVLKPVLQELYERYGVNVETLSRGRFATLMATHEPFDAAEREHLEAYMREVYSRFVGHVAQGRGMAPERVEELGRGRIWSGTDALTHGLIDEIGDLTTAVSRARALAGLADDSAVWRVAEPTRYLLPTRADPTTLLRTLGPSLRERAWLMTEHPLAALP